MDAVKGDSQQNCALDIYGTGALEQVKQDWEPALAERILLSQPVLMGHNVEDRPI